MILQTGVIRLAVLATVDGSKSKIFYLPPPSKDGLELEWVRKGSTKELINGAERTRTLGYLPVLTCKWPVYDERSGMGYAIGPLDGQRPGLEALLGFLSLSTGMLRISPGLSSGGFTVDAVDVKGISKRGSIYTGLQATFRARDPLSTMTLEAF